MDIPFRVCKHVTYKRITYVNPTNFSYIVFTYDICVTRASHISLSTDSVDLCHEGASTSWWPIAHFAGLAEILLRVR